MTRMTPLKGTNALRARSANRQAVLGHIQTAGVMGRAEIAREMGLSTQAVSNIIADLSEDGMLLERGTRNSGRGQPAVQYGVNPEGGYALGFELRPDAMFGALLDLSGQTVATHRIAHADGGPRNAARMVVDLRDKVLGQRHADKLLGAGIVMPGPFGQTGLSGQGTDLQGWHDTDPRKLFDAVLDLPIEVSNDANASAMAERIKGAALGLHSYAYLYFGAGLGLGLVSNGQLVSGAFGNAGEIGHLPFATENGTVPLESALSRMSLQRHLAARGQPPADFEQIAVRHAANDPAVADWIALARPALAHAVQIVENLFDPQTIVLGGAMPESLLGDLVGHTELSRQSVSNRADNPLPRVQRGACGRLTATLGAAALILNRAFTPQSALA